MANLWRISALAERHRQLGSNLEDWNGMGTAWTYASDTAEHYLAIRTKAGLMDVSGLKKCIMWGLMQKVCLNMPLHATFPSFIQASRFTRPCSMKKENLLMTA
jgi:glycine cleavage system aminomethyltransferase T